MDLHSLLILGHITGVSLGLGGSFIAEAQIGRALRDKQVGEDERSLMHANYFLIRVGLALVVLSGIGLVWWHLSQGNNWVLTSEKLWAKETMVVIILLNAFLMTKRLIPLSVGAAVSFTSWLGAATLGVWRNVPFSFWEIMLGYAVAVVFFMYLLNYLRSRA